MTRTVIMPHTHVTKPLFEAVVFRVLVHTLSAGKKAFSIQHPATFEYLEDLRSRRLDASRSHLFGNAKVIRTRRNRGSLLGEVRWSQDDGDDDDGK